MSSLRMQDDENKTIRNFVTKCKFCMNTVLYWESSRGSKVFFNYPIGEKLQRHHCKEPVKNTNPKSFAEQQFELHHQEYAQCPVCGKIFDQMTILNQHINDSQESDLDHREFAKYFLEPSHFENKSSNIKAGTKIQSNVSGNASFGRIFIRKGKIKEHKKKT